MPLFSYPLFFIAAISLPALIIVYKFRNQSKPTIVSSLMLWDLNKQPNTGGTKMKKLPLPLSLFIELFILLMLVLSAATPLILSSTTPSPLVVILDDSYSMLAGADNSARNQAMKIISDELDAHNSRMTHFVLAGKEVTTLGNRTNNKNLALEQLENWLCRSPQSDINKAISFVHKVFDKKTSVLIISDHLPEEENIAEGIKWVSLGRPYPNTAFINATRTTHGARERYLFEISNLSSHAISTALTLKFSGSNTPPQSRPIQLGPNDTKKIIIELPLSLRPLIASLSDDQLNIDNSVTLMPQQNSSVTVNLNVSNNVIRSMFEKTLTAAGAILADTNYQLLITDNTSATAQPDTWVLNIHNIDKANAYTGPFIVEKTSSLAEGVYLDGVIWGASPTLNLPGTPIITAANIPLLTEEQYNDKSHIFNFQIAPDLSTLSSSTAWPILVWNLIEQRKLNLPGPDRNNYRLGEQALFTIEDNVKNIEVTPPDGVRISQTNADNKLIVNLDQTGIWSVKADRSTYKISVNPLSFSESNLSPNNYATLDNWAPALPTHDEYRSVAWIFLLISLGALTAHLYIIRRRTS